MSIITKESQAEQTNSAEVYVFTLGSVKYYRTSYFRSLVIGANTYTAFPIQRTGYRLTCDLSPAECSVSMKVDDAMVAALIAENNLKGLTVEINRYFLDNLTEYKNLFTGTMVGGYSISGGVITINFKDMLYLLDNEICRVRMQSMCNNQLFDSVCALDSDTYKVEATVTIDTTGKILTSATFGLQSDGYFTMGKVQYGDSKRIITSHDGNVITLNRAISDLESGNSVFAWPGCDKNPATCKERFDNIENFVGMPYIPLKDVKETALTNS